MYRIEVTPGEETVFRTMEELAVAIRNGVVTPRARIYHNASQKWLPIGLHPHYKKALELPASSSAHPKTPDPVPAKPLIKARVEPHTAEHPVEPKPAPAPKVPAPVVSPVVAMQQEVLRDLRGRSAVIAQAAEAGEFQEYRRQSDALDQDILPLDG